MERLQLLKLMSCRNITEEQLLIIHMICKVYKMSSKLVYTSYCSLTDQRPAADVQRVHQHGAFLIKKNETYQREYKHIPKYHRSFVVQRKRNKPSVQTTELENINR